MDSSGTNNMIGCGHSPERKYLGRLRSPSEAPSNELPNPNQKPNNSPKDQIAEIRQANRGARKENEYVLWVLLNATSARDHRTPAIKGVANPYSTF